jgi:hypothetical protein
MKLSDTQSICIAALIAFMAASFSFLRGCEISNETVQECIKATQKPLECKVSVHS